MFATLGYVTEDPTALAYHDPPYAPAQPGRWELRGHSVTKHDTHDNRYFIVLSFQFVPEVGS